VKFIELIWYYMLLIPTWTALTVHNTWGILNVFFIVWLRPMKGGMVDSDHPIVTGINPETGNQIWNENVIFRSERKREFTESDEHILATVGAHMSKMIEKSASHDLYPHGIPDRMPPAINYIHGGVQYNGGFLIFDDVKDAIRHFSDWKFRKEFWRFILVEKREPVTVLRDKNYNREEFLEFVCFLRSMFPYFSNSNGNKKRIGWGNPAPYPSVNTITGHWKRDTYKFYHQENLSDICRPPIKAKYFQHASYYGIRDTVRWPEKWLARFTDNRIISRGEKGNLFFVDLRKINKGYRFNPAQLPNFMDRVMEKISQKI